MKFIQHLALLTMYALPCVTPVAAYEEHHGKTSSSITRAGGVSGQDHHYVISEMLVPSSPSQAINLGLNIDGDAGNQVDNAFGQFTATLQSMDLDIQAPVDEQVVMGDVINLLNFRTTDFTSTAESALWVFTGGNPSNPPCTAMGCGNHLDGSTMFDIVPKAPSEPMIGPVTAGEFTGGPGRFRVDLPFLSETIALDLIATQAEIGGNSSSLSGKLGGGIPEEDIENTVVPAMADSFADIVAKDCTGTSGTCGCTSDSSGETLIIFFDTSPMDCQITENEVANSSLIASALGSDIDLLDANGDFNPGQDGVNDHLSFGFGIDSVGAEFTLIFLIFLDGFEL